MDIYDEWGAFDETGSRAARTYIRTVVREFSRSFRRQTAS